MIYLGTWKSHIHYVKNKVSSGLYALNSSKHTLEKCHLKIIYHSLIGSYLNYGTLLWGAATKKIVKPLEVLQNKALRIITHSSYNASSVPLYRDCKILPLVKLHELSMVRLMFLHNNQTLPTNLQSKFVQNRDIHEYNTRRRNHPHLFKINTTASRNSFVYKAPVSWYNLDEHIQNCHNVKVFVWSCKRQFLSDL